MAVEVIRKNAAMAPSGPEPRGDSYRAGKLFVWKFVLNFEAPDGHKQVPLGNRLPLVGKPCDKNCWKTIFLPSFQGKGCQLGQASPLAIVLVSEVVVGLPVMWLLLPGAHLS